MRLLQAADVPVGHFARWAPELDAGMEAAPAYSLTTDMYDLFCLENSPINLDVPARGDFWNGYTIREAMQAIVANAIEKIGETKAIKDPRITWHPWLIRGWYEGLGGKAKVLYLHRRSEQVDKSRQRFAFDDPKRSRIGHPEVYMDDFRATLVEMLTYDIPFELLMFPNFLRNRDSVIERLNRLNVAFDEEKFCSAWDQMIDFGKVHF
jgi:hypothetical protein